MSLRWVYLATMEISTHIAHSSGLPCGAPSLPHGFLALCRFRRFISRLLLYRRSRNRRVLVACCLSSAVCNRSFRSEINHLQIVIGDLCRTNNVRNNREYNFVLLPLLCFLAEEILQDRDLRKSWVSAQRFCLRVFKNAANQVHFPVGQARLVLDATLADGGFCYSINGLLPGYRRNLERNLKSYFIA